MTRDGRESTYPWVNSWQRGRIGKQAPGARWPPTPQYSISRCSPTVMVRVIGWIRLRRGTGSTCPQFVKQSCNEEAAEGEGSPRKRMPTKQEHRREHQQYPLTSWSCLPPSG
jgi:hypothetical protein